MSAGRYKDGVFKAYDIRGIYPEEIDERFAFDFGRAFTSYLRCSEVVIGRDNRLSGEDLSRALAEGITASGADVVDCGLCSTDTLYFAAADAGYKGGIMVTASHNPPEYNGFKLVREKAVPIGGESGLTEIKTIMQGSELPVPSVRGEVVTKDVLPDFVSFCRSFVEVDTISGLKVVMDTANAMGGMIAPKMFANMDIDIVPLYFEMDGTFPNHPANPFLEENRLELMERVVKEKADLGIAWDGDTDRCFFIDENGVFVNSDFIIGMLVSRLLARTPGATILYDLRASKYVPKTIELHGGIAQMCRVGHAFIKNSMREIKAVFAGEVSGHYYYYDPVRDFYADNGWIPALQVLELLSRERKTFSELLAVRKQYHLSGELNVKVTAKDEKIKTLSERFSDADRIYYLDGISVEYPDWWFNLRASNTEPLLRLTIEADSPGTVADQQDLIMEIIR